MRRKDREVTDDKLITEIISKCHCCRLAFFDNDAPYIVPMNFGFEQNGKQFVFYFHSAMEGRKIELIKTCNTVGFELDTNYMLQEADKPCGYSARFQSIIGTGNISFLTDYKDKKYALSQIMFHNTGKKEWEFPTRMLDAVAVFKLVVKELSCKEHKWIDAFDLSK